MVLCTLRVEVDKSARSNVLFHSLNNLVITKEDIFSHGVLIGDVPPRHLYSSDFEYLHSRMPHWRSLFEDFLQLDNNRIIVNNSIIDTFRSHLSEFVGVGVGLYYSTKILNINLNKFSKIPSPSTIIKRLDYRAINNSKVYEIETKGTTYKSNINACVVDCLKKKRSSVSGATLRFGAITLLMRENNKGSSKLVICDDPETNNKASFEDNVNNILNHYAFILSFILNTIIYNRFANNINRKNRKLNALRNILPKNKFNVGYKFSGKTYFGGFFDRRLIFENIKKYVYFEKNVIGDFEELTKKVGRIKYFLGVDERVIDLINSERFEELLNYTHKEYSTEKNKFSLSLLKNGVIFIKSIDDIDTQFKENYPDNKVKEILNLIIPYMKKESHKCGASCKSKNIEGKPCDIRTYNKHCHFHR